MIKIDRNIKVQSLIEEFPHAGTFLVENYGFHCANCFLAGFDTLEEGAKVHGIVGKMFDEMIEELENFLNDDSI